MNFKKNKLMLAIITALFVFSNNCQASDPKGEKEKQRKDALYDHLEKQNQKIYRLIDNETTVLFEKNDINVIDNAKKKANEIVNIVEESVKKGDGEWFFNREDPIAKNWITNTRQWIDEKIQMIKNKFNRTKK